MLVRGGTAAPGGETLRVLLVEDSPADRELVKRAFREPLTGPLDVEAVTDAGAALAAARELKPALDLVTQTTAQLLRARAAAVMIRTEAERVLVSVWGALKEAPGLKSADLLAALGTGFPETATGVLRGERGAEI